jgi:asparagine synthase (glutamine-hydrolysing)
MSAIAGIYNLDQQPVEPDVLGRMNAAMAHRSPDGRRLWAEGPIGFAHGMLWTTPESQWEQLPKQQEHWVITADARIDNRDELIAQLGFDRRDSSKITDSDLILAAYRKWGEDCPGKLLGDFAFALWDSRHQKLFCARDPMGVKPFIYYYSPHLFAFASEIKALFQIPNIPKIVNELRIAQLLLRHLDDREITSYQHILRLPAAHTLTVAAGNIRLRKYWQLDREFELKLKSDYEYAEAYREQLTQAVKCRMRSALPIGSMLSGGLDSSSIACTARTLLKDSQHKTLHTFSTTFDSLPDDRRQMIDERFYVDKVLEQSNEDGHFTPHFIEGDRLNPLEHSQAMFHHMDEPFFAPNLYYNWAWYDRAKQNNVRVVLDGIDGDSTVSHGQPYLYELVNKRQFVEYAKQVRAYARLMQVPMRTIAWEWGLQELFPSWIYYGLHRLQEWRQPNWKKLGLNIEFGERLKLSSYEHQRSEAMYALPAMKTARHVHAYSLDSGLIQYALELSDRTAAAFNLELRYPFCDRRLMEFCVSLPPEQKFQRGVTRLIARRATEGILPDEIRQRLSKANLGANTKPQLLNYEKVRMEHYLFSPDSTVAPYIDRQQVKEAYDRYQKDTLREQDALTLYGLTNLGLWLEKA